MVNPDAAIEAVTLAYGGESFTASTAGGRADRRAWGRKMTVPAGRTLELSLDVDPTADYDLHIYEATPGVKGRPVLPPPGFTMTPATADRAMEGCCRSTWDNKRYAMALSWLTLNAGPSVNESV